MSKLVNRKMFPEAYKMLNSFDWSKIGMAKKAMAETAIAKYKSQYPTTKTPDLGNVPSCNIPNWILRHINTLDYVALAPRKKEIMDGLMKLQSLI